MYFLLDILIIAIYVLVIWHFKNKGFLKASETVVSIILTFSLMPVFAPVFGEIIDNSPVGREIHRKIESVVAVDDNAEDALVLPEILQDSLHKAEDMKDTVVKNTANQITSVIIKVLSFILLYVLIKIAIFILFRILIFICHIRVLGFFNKLLGMIFGFFDATIIVYLICALAFIFVPTDTMAALKDGISNTVLADYFYNKNILINLFL